MSRSILVLPGGGYSGLADHEGEPVAEWLRGLGWDARVVRYPVKTRHPGPLNFVKKELIAERATGAAQVGMIGFSAGGHLAGHAALALAPDMRPDFAVLCYPVVSMVTPTHGGSRQQLIGSRAWPWVRRSVSLEHLVTRTSPPMFIWSTGDDASVPVGDHTYRLGSALAAAGVDHDLHVFDKGGPHGIGLAPGTATGQAWTHLAEQWLAKR